MFNTLLTSYKITLQKSLFFIFIIICFFTLPLLSKDLDLDAIVAKAAKKKMPVLLFFHKPHCGFCDNMIKYTLKDSDVVKQIEKNFIFVDIYIKEDGKITFNNFTGSRRDFAKHIGYDFYPTTVFIDSSRKIIHIVPGQMEQDDFMNVLNYITTKQYKKMELQTYLDTIDFERDF